MAAKKKSLRDRDAELRRHVLDLLHMKGAHVGFDETVAGIPARLRGIKPKGLPYSAWQLVEHMRRAQDDILRFCVEPDYVSPEWPAGYWPAEPAPPNARAWSEAGRAFRADLAAMQKLVASPRNDLLAPIPHAAPATLLREALLVADHNAYHTGQLLVVRRLLRG
jgi:DinB superfamily